MKSLKKGVGSLTWVIPEGYMPEESTGLKPELESHETACVLNTSEKTAHLEFYIYFSDRDPIGPFRCEVGPQRTSHIRFNDLVDPEPIPLGTDYSSVIQSDQPVVVQHSRLDSRQSANALLTTMAFPVSDISQSGAV